VLRCCAILGKTQREIENEYAWIDIPRLLEITNERRAMELLDNIEVSTFPHISDEKVRESILKRHRDKLPQPPNEPPKSAEEQYQALVARMKAGG
jgi:hypothetical protein